MRPPDAQQQRVVELAHRAGMHVTSHEIFPASAVGVDGTSTWAEKTSALGTAYGDVMTLMLKSGMTLHPAGWFVDVPRPTWAIWFGDTWRMTDRLTVNDGVRWDDDPGATAPPGITENVILIDNGRQRGDFGHKAGIRDHDNVAPRAGFAYDVTGAGDFRRSRRHAAVEHHRLNLGAPVTIPESVRDRFEGPGIIERGARVPRNALRGDPLHKVDVRVTKELALGRGARASLMAEVFNLFDHANYGSYNGSVNSSTFGQPRSNAGARRCRVRGSWHSA